MQGWAKDILEVCEAGMQRMAVCSSADDVSQHVDTVCRCLFVVGEIAVLGLEDSKEGVKPATSGTALPVRP